MDDSQNKKNYPKNELILERSKTGNNQYYKNKKSFTNNKEIYGLNNSSFQKRGDSHFKRQITNFKKDNDKFTNFQKFQKNKVTPLRNRRKSDKNFSPEEAKLEKKNNSSLYDVSMKGGSVLDKMQSNKHYG